MIQVTQALGVQAEITIKVGIGEARVLAMLCTHSPTDTFQHSPKAMLPSVSFEYWKRFVESLCASGVREEVERFDRVVEFASSPRSKKRRLLEARDVKLAIDAILELPEGEERSRRIISLIEAVS